jgi:hypothetical protein
LFRAFWLTLFAIGAVMVLATGWRGGEPWTAAAFVVFFASRAARSVIKRPLMSTPVGGDAAAARRLQLFLIVTVAGWLGSGVLAVVAAVAGEGQEWIYVAPVFLLMGAAQLYLFLRRD